MSSPEARRPLMGGATDVGAVRAENEDSYGSWGPDVGEWDFLIAVADGVGGHEHGKQASELAISAFIDSLTRKSLPRSDPGIRSALVAGIADANRAVYSAFSGSGTARPGSTFTCVLARGGKSFVGHVGDSRAYMIHGGCIFQLSTDHTWVQLQVENGAMTAEEAAVSPYRNQVLKVLGAEPDVEPDVVVRPAVPGDLFVVCSDGVTEHVGVGQLLAESTQAHSAEGLAQTLVALAVAQGGSDNATAVVAGVPLSAAAGGGPAKPETTDIPLLRHSDESTSTAATRLAPSTIPLPSAPHHARPKRDWRPAAAIALGVLFMILGLLLIRAVRPQEDSPSDATAAVGADLSSSPEAMGMRVKAEPPVRLDGPVARLMRQVKLLRPRNVVFSASGRRYACFDDDQTYIWIICFDTDTGRELFRVKGAPSGDNGSYDAVFSPDDRYFYYRSEVPLEAGRTRLYRTDVETGLQTSGIGKPEADTTGGMAIRRPKGDRLVVADTAESMGDCTETASGALYDAHSGRQIRRLPKIEDGYRRLVFSPRGSFLAGETGAGLRVFRTASLEEAYSLPNSYLGLLGNCDARLAVVADQLDRAEVRLLDWLTGQEAHRYRAPFIVALSPSLKWYVASDEVLHGASDVLGVTLRDLTNGQVLQRLEPAHPPSTTRRACLSEDGKLLAVCADDRVLIFEVESAYQ